MAERAHALAEQFDLVARSFIEFIEGLDDEQWRMIGKNHPTIRQPNTEDEGRPVGVIAYHTAASIRRQRVWLAQLANGEPLSPPAMSNAQQAEEHKDVTRQEVLDLLNEGVPALVAFIRGLDGEQLDRSGHTVAGELTTAGAIERVAVGHILWHRGSIEATIAPSL